MIIISRPFVNENYSEYIDLSVDGNLQKISWFLDEELLGTGAYWTSASGSFKCIDPYSAVLILNAETGDFDMHCFMSGLEYYINTSMAG